MKLGEICRVLSVTIVYLAVSCAAALDDVYLVGVFIFVLSSLHTARQYIPWYLGNQQLQLLHLVAVVIFRVRYKFTYLLIC